MSKFDVNETEEVFDKIKIARFRKRRVVLI